MRALHQRHQHLGNCAATSFHLDADADRGRGKTRANHLMVLGVVVYVFFLLFGGFLAVR